MNIKELAYKLREDAVNIIYKGQSGHIGSDMSVMDILVALYFKQMNISPENMNDKSRDMFVLSKGHSVEAYYAVLAEKGFFSLDEVLNGFCRPGSKFIGHPNNKLPGIEMNSGSLGHGLPVAVGMAIASKMNKIENRIYTVMGDGIPDWYKEYRGWSKNKYLASEINKSTGYTYLEEYLQFMAGDEYTDADSTPATIENFRVNKLGYSTAQVYWNTDYRASCVIEYGTEPGVYTNQEVVDYDYFCDGMHTYHSRILRELEPNTTYYYRVTATDENSSVTVAEYDENDPEFKNMTFTTTLAPSDVSRPPSTPTITKVVPYLNQVRLNWTGDNETDEGYEIYYDTVDHGSDYEKYAYKVSDLDSDTEKYIVTELENNTTYYFVVVAVNSWGKTSSEAVSAIPSGVLFDYDFNEMTEEERDKYLKTQFLYILGGTVTTQKNPDNGKYVLQIYDDTGSHGVNTDLKFPVTQNEKFSYEVCLKVLYQKNSDILDGATTRSGDANVDNNNTFQLNFFKDGAVNEDFEVKKVDDIKVLPAIEMGKGDRICVDFGDHMVGYVSLKISYAGSPPDAPVYLRLKFGEHICEIAEDTADYHGFMSSSWLQEEFIHIDVVPTTLKLPRRYAFRYLEVLTLDTSPKFKIRIDDICCQRVSAVRASSVKAIGQGKLKKIDKIAIKTLSECMQDVFEDGPKRDRRLWIGDLRLEAITNYQTFKNYDLVKRCLYLFAGVTQNRGRVGACLYLEPEPMVDDTTLFDYSLLFISCLYDYYLATNDIETLKELWDTAYRQIELSEELIGEDGVVLDSDKWWCFIDWTDGLNKQAGAQAIFIYALKQAKILAKILGDDKRFKKIDGLIIILSNGAVEKLWDEHLGFFTSGSERQVSWASQVWFVLAEVFDKEKNQELLKRTAEQNPSYKMVTPYMHHYYVDALMKCDMIDTAKKCILEYWGGMVDAGADCFYECYNPDNINESPYSFRSINSYCHAWSCTPSYFIRKYLSK